ncbi:glycosyltransferase [Rhizobium sp. NFR03]|uniref:glycosyltransferase n=1 Tax=Rhizobium sp. NFR03 TaxID=1566263 RepID=UPI0008B437EC|nr:glycosyltransferase [Rhizobium sp. NFR03]SES31495.1 Glycosyltransferase, GT2 family [Rhizobium sp. NFR03]
MSAEISLDDQRHFAAIAAMAQELRHAIASAPRWVQLAHLLKDAGALEDAERAYRTAIRCDGTEWDARLHLAHLLKRLNRLPEALSMFEAIRALPDGPNVEHEIAGLRVALLPENSVIQRPAAPPPASPLAPSVQPLLDDLSGELARTGIDPSDATSVGNIPTAQPGAAGQPRLLPLICSADLNAELVPKANLVLRDGVLTGTTGNPQFEIRCATAPVPGWIEIEFGIDMKTPIIEPILYVEHAPQWQTFSTFRLAPRNGRFHAFCRVDAPILSLRLDPSHSAGPFAVTQISLRQIGLSRVVRHAWKRDRTATRDALARRRHEGPAAMEAALAQCLANSPLDAYQRWIRRYETPSRLSANQASKNVARWPKKPALAVLVEWDPEGPAPLAQTLASLGEQVYPHWTLDILAPRPLTASERLYIEAVVPGVAFPTDLPTAIGSRSGGHIVHVDAGDRLSPAALFRLAEEIFARRGKGTDIIYTDEDHLVAGERRDPLFKPDWDPDFQASTGYIGPFVAIRQDRLTEGLSALSDRWQDVLKTALAGASESDVLHLPDVLNHRHAKPETVAFQPPSPSEPAGGWPHVTLMIPTRDSVDILRKGVASLLRETDYPSFDILIIDNGSSQAETLTYFEEVASSGQVGIVNVPGPFNFAHLNNRAAAVAKGAVLGLVNNDILAIEPSWLKTMVAEAVRPDIGAVGAKLLYPSGHVQHGGMACGVGYVTAHPQKFKAEDDRGYMDTLVATHRVSTVTAACLIVERHKYAEVGGMDEDALQIAFNDVDLCLKLDAAGYRNLMVPAARLIHLESATRGLDMTGEKADRFRREAETVLARWKPRITNDPYYSVNLTQDREDGTIRD